MDRIVIVKNTDVSDKVYAGQTIFASDEHQVVSEAEANNLAQDTDLFTDIGSGLVVINDGSVDYADPIKGYDWLKGNPIKDSSGIPVVHATVRVPGLVTYFTGSGDDSSSSHLVGGGESFWIHHEIGDPEPHVKYIDFNFIENPTDIYEGIIEYINTTPGDSACLEIVPQVTNYSASSNTFFNLYGGYLVVPAAGDGVIAINPADMNLIEMPLSKDTGKRGAAYWNADYNTGTHSFENITAAPYGDGVYNMFGVEVPLNRFVYEVVFIRSEGERVLKSHDANSLGHGMRFKILLHTQGTDHDWHFGATITMYRDNTI